jgi:CubicO group peptidase (beta-lactamase class C family)
MRKINLLLAFILIITAEVSSQTSRKSLEEKLPQVEIFLKAEMETRQIPGLAYGIFDESEMVASGTYGLANVQHQVPVKIETIFPLASITKQFTAAAILILQQDGKLKVSDKLCQYLEECPEQWSEITLYQLLTHTSGLPGSRKEDGSPNMMAEYTGIHQMDPVRVGMSLLTVLSKQYLFDLMKTNTPDTPPGTAFNYSNTGYILLGIVIDHIAGSYRGFLEERIFKPVGMNNTYLKDGETIHYNVAGEYTLRNGELIKNDERYITEIGSAGHVFSNILDLQKWDAVLNTEKILTKESKAPLWTKHTLANGRPIQVSVPGLKPFGVGYGWAVLPDSEGRKVVWHNGSSGTEFLKAVDDKLSIVILTNLGEGRYDQILIHGLNEGVAKILGIYHK